MIFKFVVIKYLLRFVVKNEVEIYEQKTYPAIDILKFVFAITVVALHTNLIPNSKTEYVPYIFTGIFLRLAVPFFFVVSGYFLVDKLFSENKEKYFEIIKNYSIKLLFPLIIYGGGSPKLSDMLYWTKV